MTELEEDYLFHTLGYDSKPNWNSKRKENRNFFGTSSNDETINSLVVNGYMKVKGNFMQETIYCATDKGIEYVERRFKEKVESAKKPTRSQRRYQCYLHLSDGLQFDDFGHFIKWLKITEEDRMYDKTKVEFVERIKKEWKI